MKRAIALLLLGAYAQAYDGTESVRLRMLQTALSQAEKRSGYWSASGQDCAGFIRFTYRNSLALKGSGLWLNRLGHRVDYVSAGELVAYNFEPLTRDVSSARLRTGDLLVFYSANRAPADAWHLMLVLDPPPGAPGRHLLIYHNGSTRLREGERGEVRKVWLDDLLATGESQWRPVDGNPRFQGVFRWKGWKALNGEHYAEN